MIDLGETCAPHGVMIDALGAVWSSGELANAVFVIDPATDTVHRIEVGNPAHWLAISQATGKVFVSVKTDFVIVIDAASRAVVDRIKVPHPTEGLAISPDGARLYVCAKTAAEFYVIDARTHEVLHTVSIGGTDPTKTQMRRVRVSPGDRYIVLSLHQENQAAVYAVDDLRLLATFPTNKGPMGFGFAPGGKHAYLCCHNDAVVIEFELESGKATRSFPTAAGCEFIVAYH